MSDPRDLRQQSFDTINLLLGMLYIPAAVLAAS